MKTQHQDTPFITARLTEIRADLTNIAEHLHRTDRIQAVHLMTAVDSIADAVVGLKKEAA
mgnify:CR=1 FL=1